ncbi:MAG TPA: hypothetical protein VFA53_09290 [Xanthobacteraceae bacterium]|nr:hypothetical protein [Xanthobacteraceae bacterium]
MIRSLLRLIGLVLLAGGFVFFIYDGTKSIADRAIYISKFSQTWADVHQQSLRALQTMVEQKAPWLWNPVLQTVLDQPSWLVLGTLGIILILLGRKKRPLIGYAR